MKSYILLVTVCIYLSSCITSGEADTGNLATLGECKTGLARVNALDTFFYTYNDKLVTYNSTITLNCARKKVSFTGRVSGDTLYVQSHVLDDDPNSRALCVCSRDYVVSLEITDSSLGFINQDDSPISLPLQRK